MNRRRTSLALVIYWGLLINLGPSLHTLSFFGLHGQGCCQPKIAVSQLDLSGDCCCCDHHSKPGSKQSAEVQTPVERNIVAHSSCSFCKFFKHYQADSEQPESFEPLEKIEAVRPRSKALYAAGIVQTRARGPPSLHRTLV